jgi:hypothetical protein
MAAACDGDSSQINQLIRLLIELHSQMIARESRAKMVRDMTSLALDGKASALARVCAMLLLGGHDASTIPEYRALTHQDDPVLALFACASHCISTVRMSDEWATEDDPNAKATVAFWASALLTYANIGAERLVDPLREHFSRKPSASTLFWQVLVHATDPHIRDALARLVRDGPMRVAHMSLSLLCRSEVAQDTWGLLRSVIASEKNPESLRSYAVSLLIQSRIPDKHQFISTTFLNEPSSSIRMLCLSELLIADADPTRWDNYAPAVRKLADDLASASDAESLVGLFRNAQRYDTRYWTWIRSFALSHPNEAVRSGMVRGMGHPSVHRDACIEQARILQATIRDPSKKVRVPSVQSLFSLLNSSPRSPFLATTERIRLLELVAAVGAQEARNADDEDERVRLTALAQQARVQSEQLRAGQ